MITKLQGLGLGDQFAHFHAKVPEVEKQAELDRFLGGKARILLATTALGAGFDFSHVDVVIHWRGSYSFCDFMQESGRTGRSTGRPGWSFCAVTDYDRQPRDSNSVEEVEFKKYLNERICRRAAISRYFNGFDQSCEPGMTSCDLCTMKQNQASRVQQAVRQRQQESARQIEWFAEAVRFWQERGCLRCFYHYWIMYSLKPDIDKDPSPDQFIGHGTEACPNPKLDRYVKQLSKLRKHLEPRAETCCFTCFLPTKVCKGPLAGDTCFAPSLVGFNWSLSKEFRQQKWAVSSEYYPLDILPAEMSHESFTRWKWDTGLETELIRAAELLWLLSKHLSNSRDIRISKLFSFTI
ncbi:hypothetical protein ASPCAL15133 [Aspergillus calidoustus]|nr:hypothetical protein ASPCAL15133 [Aspergillus calidoustus]